MENHIEDKVESWTTIAVLKSTRAKLDTLKITRRETKQEIVTRLIANQK